MQKYCTSDVFLEPIKKPKYFFQIGLTGRKSLCIIRLPFDDGREESRASKRVIFKN
jgi:hypothetical protein